MRSNAVGMHLRIPTAVCRERTVCLWPARARRLVAGRGVANVHVVRVATAHAEQPEQAEEAEPSGLGATATIVVVVLRLRVTEIALAARGGSVARPRSRGARGACAGLTSRRAGGSSSGTCRSRLATTSRGRLRVHHRHRRRGTNQHQVNTGPEFHLFRTHEHPPPPWVEGSPHVAARRGSQA